MSWIVKGYVRTGHVHQDSRRVIDREVQYVADVLSAIREAIELGAVEVMAVKTTKGDD